MNEYIVDVTGLESGDYAIAREPIVRCRDCVAYEPYLTFAGMKLDYGECMQHKRQTNDDRFCWWAERSDR